MGREETTCDSKNEALEDENFIETNREYVRNKMEVMQQRIDELKEKVRTEGELLNSENSFKSDILDTNFQDSFNSLQKHFDHSSGNESGSSKSLYYSASNYSLCSFSSSSSETALNNFTRFVNTFVKNQNPKERLSLLQLHSKKQISLNMMKHSLMELDTRCAEELQLIERSLQHLNRLAREFNFDSGSDTEHDNGKLKAIEYHTLDSKESKKINCQRNSVLVWPHEERKSRMNVICNPFLFNIDMQEKSSVRE